MKAEAGTTWPERTLPRQGRRWDRVIRLICRIPYRLRERRFWRVQALVFVAIAPHYLIEIVGFRGPFEGHQLHALAITLYIVPLLYAALNFSREGAVLTALWLAALTSPSIWIWHLAEFHWLALSGQLAITLPVGILVARSVDLEARQRRRAEETSASLTLLNEIGQTLRLRHTLDVEQQLPVLLRRLLTGLSLQSVWLLLKPESTNDDLLVIEEAAGPGVSPAMPAARDLHARTVSTRKTVTVGGHSIVVPLLTEAGVLGSLGATVAGEQTIADQQVELLTTVAQQVSVAVENARLYRQRQESLRSYAQQVTQAQEEERLRIARELHDETAQELVYHVRKLEQVRDGPASSLRRSIDELLDQTRGTLQSVRRFSRDLRPSVLDDLGLLAAIETVVDETNNILPQGARLKVSGTPRRVDQPVELALFRIAQEALRNVEKHAEASSATVELDFGSEEIKLSVTDDGCGFSPVPNISDLPQTGKLGLLGMKERAELVGGRFELHSSPSEGTRLVVRVTPDSVPAGPAATGRAPSAQPKRQ